MSADPPKVYERKRKPINVTLDDDWTKRAKAMADSDGLTLSRWIEQLIRAEHARRAERAPPRKKK